MKINKYENDFELADVLSNLEINNTVIHQILKNQNRAIMMITEAFINHTVNISKYISEEMHSEAIRDLHEFKRITDGMKKANDES